MKLRLICSSSSKIGRRDRQLTARFMRASTWRLLGDGGLALAPAFSPLPSLDPMALGQPRGLPEKHSRRPDPVTLRVLPISTQRTDGVELTAVNFGRSLACIAFYHFWKPFGPFDWPRLLLPNTFGGRRGATNQQMRLTKDRRGGPGGASPTNALGSHLPLEG